ncbi:hypothetical protein TNCV_631061 [Trichonephila clavipes]|nr:hypothetical protein TNCV_631061 [Trichonephila clavipes]
MCQLERMPHGSPDGIKDLLSERPELALASPNFHSTPTEGLAGRIGSPKDLAGIGLSTRRVFDGIRASTL